MGSEPGLESLEDRKISVLPTNQNITHPNPTHSFSQLRYTAPPFNFLNLKPSLFRCQIYMVQSPYCQTSSLSECHWLPAVSPLGFIFGKWQIKLLPNYPDRRSQYSSVSLKKKKIQIGHNPPNLLHIIYPIHV